MNRKQLITLLALVAIIGGAGLVLLKKKDESWSGSDTKLGQKLLEKFQVNDVARIHIKADKDVNLVKKDDLWRVEERGDYPANYSSISDFLIKAADLKIAQVEPIGESQLERLELQEPGKAVKAGTLVEFKDAKGSTLQTLLLGKKHVKKMENAPQFRYGGGDEFSDGRYVMVGNDRKNVILISDALASAEPKPDNWLNKDFLKVEKIKSASLVSTNATNSWSLTRQTENGSWSLADLKPGENFDTNKASATGSTLTSPSFADISINAKPEDTGLDKPQVVTVSTFDHFTYTFKVGKKTPEGNFYCNISVAGELPKERTPGKDEKPEDKTKLDKEFADKKQALADKLKLEQSLEKWTYQVPSWILEPLVKNRAELMVEKKEEPKADAAQTGADQGEPPAIPDGITPPPPPSLKKAATPKAPAIAKPEVKAETK